MSSAFSKLKSLFRKLRRSHIDINELDSILAELQRTLIDADVNVDLVRELASKIRKRILETKVPEGLPLNTIVMRALYEELVSLLGEKRYDLNIKPGKRNIIVLVGLQGSGKTTTCAKLAKWLKKRGLKVAVICADTYRPAAYEQLKQLTESINVPYYGEPKEKDPIKIIREGLKKFNKFDVVIIDTAGRHKEESGLMKEMREIVKKTKPSEILLVIDGMIGQRAYDQAKAFKDTVGEIGGIIITKLDGSAKGGGALSAAAAAKAPVKFIGVGERVEDIEPYDPPDFVARILGMPDKRFLEQILETLPERFMHLRELTLKDLRDYYESMLRKGSGLFGRIREMFAGNISERELKKQLGKTLAVLKAMNEDELYNVELLKDAERIDRIARGSGVDRVYVRRFIKQYHKLKKMVNVLMKQRGLRKDEALRQIMEGKIDTETIEKIARKMGIKI